MRRFSVSIALPAVVCVCLILSRSELTAQNTGPAFHWPEGKRVAVSLSFDDARASQVDVGVSLFDTHGVKVTFYVNPKSLEKRLDGFPFSQAAPDSNSWLQIIGVVAANAASEVPIAPKQ